MKRTAITFIGILLCVCGTSCNRHKDQTNMEPPKYKDTGGITLDADVPGTQVYLAGQKLGTVPVTLSAKDLVRLGIPNPQMDTNVLINSDGGGQTVFVAKWDDPGKKLFMYAVPENVRANYVSIETPWGIRTMHEGSNVDFHKSIRVHCAKIIRHDGLSLQLEAVDSVASQMGPWKLKVVLANHSQQVIKGFRPAFLICHSSFSSHWSSKGANTIPSLKEWASINPGQTLETEIEVAPADTKGDYGLYVIFQLFKDETSDYLAGDGWLYSNTKLFSVR